MKRRAFIAALGIFGTPLDAFAQPAKRVYRVGVLRPTSAPDPADPRGSGNVLRAALERLGYVEGRNLVIETRYAEGNVERLPALARELVQQGVHVIVSVGSVSARVAKQATSTIPIIMYGNFDPVAVGLATSLARPGGNATGVLIAPDGTLAAKKLELLKEALPNARRMVVLAPGDIASARPQLAELKNAAAALNVELPIVEVRSSDYAEAFMRIAAIRPDALFVLASAYFMIDRKPIIDLTLKYRLPSMWEWREQVEDGGLMSYGSSLAERYQRIAEHIDRIFKGRAPGELPIDRPMAFELVLNMKTAKALGVTFPPVVLVRADRVIQ